MSFVTAAIAGAVATTRGALREAEERKRQGLPPRRHEPTPERERHPSDDTSSALLAGAIGYAVGSASHQDTSNTCSPTTTDSFSSGTGGDFGGGGASGEF